MVGYTWVCRKYSLPITNSSARVLLLCRVPRTQRIKDHHGPDHKGLLCLAQRAGQRKKERKPEQKLSQQAPTGIEKVQGIPEEPQLQRLQHTSKERDRSHGGKIEHPYPKRSKTTVQGYRTQSQRKQV